MTLQSLLNNARTLQSGMQSGSIVRDVLERHGRDIIEQQRIQLLEGKTSAGEDIHPSYTEDVKPRGYFYTRDSAQRYATWKQTLSYPYSVQRKPDSPNLYITGLFHSDLGVQFGSQSMAIIPDTAYAANIMAKYGSGMFGLSAEKWAVIFGEKGARDELINQMKNVLWQ